MNKEKLITGKKYKFKTTDGSIFEDEFVEFGDINYDCPGRDYASYRWDSKKQKWVKYKL